MHSISGHFEAWVGDRPPPPAPRPERPRPYRSLALPAWPQSTSAARPKWPPCRPGRGHQARNLSVHALWHCQDYGAQGHARRGERRETRRPLSGHAQAGAGDGRIQKWHATPANLQGPQVPTTSSHYHRFKPKDRVTLARLRQQNQSTRAIARRLQHSPGTISR
ncbi:MAG TPA: helix-turn-helix domain-containing protein [Acidovorax sp.]|nr:helix-turn-helix domain-containing protein [Acidovorax sp.]